MGDSIRLAHGNGGRWTRGLVEQVFLPSLKGAAESCELDAAVLALGGCNWAFTTDAFVVSPLFFPGGTIGSLAVNGTCNDLCSMGARPRFASAAFIIEEGFGVGILREIAADMGRAASAAGIALVTGDTKVVERGHGDGVFISMSGIGEIPPGRSLTPGRIREGDIWIVSGPVGDHGAAIIAARGDYALDIPVISDCCNLSPMVESLLEKVPETRFIRDCTRGGLAQVIVEASRAAGKGARLSQSSIPIRSQVEGLCDILGFDPLHLACEGRVVVAVPAKDKPAALEALGEHSCGEGASSIGIVTVDGGVILETRVGGERFLEELDEDQVPRIC